MLQNATFFNEFFEYKNRFRAYEERSVEDIFDELVRETKYLSKSGKDLVRKSYIMARDGHAGQLRKTGRPYFTHPLTIACMMIPYCPDEILLSATLLHDVLEDTSLTYRDLEGLHPDIAKIVEGATKIRSASHGGGEEFSPEYAKFETIRKILVASQKDIKIIFVKIFDRLHNMVTVDGMKPEGRIRMAEETRSVYIPLAKRSGLRKVYNYLQALVTEVLEPERWETMKTFVENRSSSIFEEAENIKTYLRAQMWSKKILGYETRFLSAFSGELRNTYQEDEWYSIQIIVTDPGDCYDILHDIGQRQDQNLIQVGRINDLITQPRLSGYTGLHVDMIFRGTHRIKLRIITQETYETITTYETFNELGNIYSPVLFRDFDLINEATSSDS